MRTPRDAPWGRILPLASSRQARSGATSARGPAHVTPAQQVEVQVVDALARVGTDVGDQAPAALVHLLGLGEVRGGLQQVEHHVRVSVLQVAEVGHVLLGDQQDVDRGARTDVAEREDRLGLVQDLGRRLAGDDAAEQAAARAHRACDPGRRSVPVLEDLLPAGSPRSRASSSTSLRCSFERSRGVSTAIVRNRSPRPRRPRFGMPLPRSRTVVPEAVPGSISTRSGPSSVSTSTSPPSAARTIGTSRTANRSGPRRSNTGSSSTRIDRYRSPLGPPAIPACPPPPTRSSMPSLTPAGMSTGIASCTATRPRP